MTASAPEAGPSLACLSCNRRLRVGLERETVEDLVVSRSPEDVFDVPTLEELMLTSRGRRILREGVEDPAGLEELAIAGVKEGVATVGLSVDGRGVIGFA